MAAALLRAGLAQAGDTDAGGAPLRKAAIIVENHAGPKFDGETTVLEDLVGSQVAGRGFSVISRDVVVQALSGQSNALDEALNDNSSALRLAQELGADYILVPTISTYGVQKKNYNGEGIATLNITYTLRVTYRIIEAGQGGALRGDEVTATKTVRQTSELDTQDSDTINELLNDAAGELADAMSQDAPSLPVTQPGTSLVHFKVACTMSDPRQAPILISFMGIDSNNHAVITNQPVAIQPLDVTVELDGAAIGSAPGDFPAHPGLHKLRLSRDGFVDWDHTVNIYDGETLRVALQMTPDGYAQWKDTTDFLATLDANRKLTDAEVNKINGIAEFFKNSHYRVDAKQLFGISLF